MSNLPFHMNWNYWAKIFQEITHIVVDDYKEFRLYLIRTDKDEPKALLAFAG